MITRKDIIEKARELGFDDIGFTTAEPFESHREYLENKKDEYSWAPKVGIDLFNGIDPAEVLPAAKSIVVLIDVYFREGFPRSMESNFGRCYLDDDRVTRNGLSKRVKEFRSFLRDNGINSKVPFHLPHRVAAARAGLGTFGKNCLFYSNKVARKSSWITPLPVIIDREFEADGPSVGMGCPDWCRNACVAACPTRALKGNGTIDPRKCISYLTYFGNDITPGELREPMGMYVYGCDRCQNVCPRNQAWLSQELTVNRKVAMKAGDFDLRKLLHMDREYFESRIWPHMFYMGADTIWKWKMNTARVMGNSLDESYVPDLVRAYKENDDERVKGMIAWALGRIGGTTASDALKSWKEDADGFLLEEIERALINDSDSEIRTA